MNPIKEIFVEETTSTQDLARHELCLPGGEQGVWVRTALQKSGRGRQGKSWLGTENALLCSRGIKTIPKAMNPSLLPLVAGNTLYSVIKNLGYDSSGIFIKWPNDLVCLKPEGRVGKLGGILVEAGRDGFVVGWGLNVNSKPNDVFHASALSEYWVALQDSDKSGAARVGVGPTLENIYTLLKESFDRELDEWFVNPTSFEAKLIDFLLVGPMKAFFGRKGRLANGETVVARGLNQSGELIVESLDGKSKSLRSAEFEFLDYG